VAYARENFDTSQEPLNLEKVKQIALSAAATFEARPEGGFSEDWEEIQTIQTTEVPAAVAAKFPTAVVVMDAPCSTCHRTHADGCRCGAFAGGPEADKLHALGRESSLSAESQANLSAVLTHVAEPKAEEPEAAVPVKTTTHEFELTRREYKNGIQSLTGIRLTDIAMRRKDFLWLGRIPLGTISLVSGKPGCGKSLAALSFIACVTTGSPWPDGAENTMGPRSVLLAATEDDFEDTIKPRLAALGADMSRIVSIQRSVDFSKKTARPLQLKEDTKLLLAALQDNPDIVLVVLDPITGFYGDVDGNSNKDIRPILQNIAKVCRDTKVCFVVIVHENKRAEANATDKILGAGALSQVIRSGMRFSPDPKGGYIMANIKNNLGKSGGGLRYTIAGKTVKLGKL